MVDQNHKPKWHVSKKQSSNARAVRRTGAERIICGNVRAGRFQGVSLRRQAADGLYVVDLVCHAASLIVEVDGGQHFGRKATLRDARRDTSRRRVAAVRFSHLDIMDNKAGVLEQIAAALGGSETFSRTLRRTREHAGREDVP